MNQFEYQVNKKMEEKSAIKLGMIAGMILSPIIVCLLMVRWLIDGFLILCIWDWFAVPMGAPPMGMAQAMGFSAFVLMSHNIPGTKSTDKENATWLRFYLFRSGMIFFVSLFLSAFV